MRDLYKFTSPKNIVTDTLLHQDKPKNTKVRLVNKKVNKILYGIKGLKEQNTIIDSISQHCSCSINQWQKVCQGLPQSNFIFFRKPIILQQLIMKTYLDGKKFFQVTEVVNTNKQTQLHMLNNCHEAVRNGRYTQIVIIIIY